MPNSPSDFMQLALEEAALAVLHDDVPVGAVLVNPEGEVVASDHNRREQLADPAAHAEMLVISKAARDSGSWRLEGHTMYVTLEPCTMCAGAAVWARLEAIVYGAADLKAGATLSLYNIPGDTRLHHQCRIEAGLHAEDAAALLKDFFGSRRSGPT